MDKLIYGADTETVNGKPNSLQFYSEDVACDDIVFVNERSARKQFIKWCASRRRNIQHVVYIHNLAFDLIEFLWGKHEKLVENGTEFGFSCEGWDIKGFYGAPTFCTVSRGHDQRIVLVDSFSFFRGTLAAAAELYCPDLPKLRRPSELGTRRYTEHDSDFIAYAMRDAVITYHIGKAVEELHREFDLTQCISVADLAARIFRHRFLKYTIPQPTVEIVHAALDSYHGGKNNVTCEPGWYEGTTNIDVSSAYPDAMQCLPAFSNASLYKRYKRAKNTREVPRCGVYLISGEISECAWPCLFDHSFKPMRGVISDVWVQGFDLNEALRSREFKPNRIEGFYYDEDRDHQAPALRGFCQDFYHRKQTEKNPVRRTGYKFILNAVSGKFIQTRKKTLRAHVDVDSGVVSDAAELVAGGMFHPFIASAITAHTRARIHRIEHHYQALHTATDGIISPKPAKLRGEFRTVQKATKLGELEADKPSATLIVRNKLYIKYREDGYVAKPDDEVSKQFGRVIGKYALHGFHGTVHDLERLVVTGKRSYKTVRMNRLKESLNRGLDVNDFVERTYNLNVGKIDVHTKRSQRKQTACSTA